MHIDKAQRAKRHGAGGVEEEMAHERRLRRIVIEAWPQRTCEQLLRYVHRVKWQDFPDPRMQLDLHGVSGAVKLDADEPVHLAAGLVVIDELAHDAAVDQLDDGIAAGDDVDVVPVFDLDEGLELGTVSERGEAPGFWPFPM